MKNNNLLLWFLLFGLQLTAQNTTNDFNVDTNSLAVAGYDVVSYFNDQKAVKGSPAYTAQVAGITYWFANEKHQQDFLKNSSYYQPQYGGWCAYAVGKTGEKVEVDPKTFKIINNKLYLFYNKYLTNTLKLWNKEEATLLPQADKNWKKIIQK